MMPDDEEEAMSEREEVELADAINHHTDWGGGEDTEEDDHGEDSESEESEQAVSLHGGSTWP